MAGMIVLQPGRDWAVTGGLCDWTLEFLMCRISDNEVKERIREILDHNLGMLWVPDFPAEIQMTIVKHLSGDLISAAE